MGGGSRARQESQAIMQDQATSPIVIEDEDDDDNRSNSVDNSGNDTNVQKSESQSRRNSSRQSLRRGITREQEKFQALLQELFTPAMGEKAENVDYAEEDADGSISQSLARLYQKATRAGLRVAKANQDEIFLCWYKYAEGFENGF
ncbi:hypothetical protein RirG_148800 [Rhizophagus irregularis DAOM 197198w]|nr:hypothetical protein RirG_148800 [Rhizophagus irregularis DAOM 197198w]